MAGPLTPNPPPLELNGFGTLERWKKRFQKVFFFLMAEPLTPSPPLNGLAIKRRTFFAASLREDTENIKKNFRINFDSNIFIRKKKTGVLSIALHPLGFN